MMIKPAPYKVSCINCRWSRSFAPKSDVLVVDECPEYCPKCKSVEITYTTLNFMESVLVALKQIKR